MQPYFLPYIGYFQLIHAVDVFVVYDDIQYTKKGWINRNRILRSGSPVSFGVPLKSASDYLDVRDRNLADDFEPERLIRQIAAAYRHAPHLAETMGFVERVMACPDRNLFAFLEHSLIEACRYLGLSTPLVRSSSLALDHELRHQDRVIAMCEALGAVTYINAPGGVDLYDPVAFRDRGIDLKFIRPTPFEYRQFDGPFVGSLSIVDVLMFNALPAVRSRVASGYGLT